MASASRDKEQGPWYVKKTVTYEGWQQIKMLFDGLNSKCIEMILRTIFKHIKTVVDLHGNESG